MVLLLVLVFGVVVVVAADVGVVVVVGGGGGGGDGFTWTWTRTCIAALFALEAVDVGSWAEARLECMSLVAKQEVNVIIRSSQRGVQLIREFAFVVTVIVVEGRVKLLGVAANASHPAGFG